MALHFRVTFAYLLVAFLLLSFANNGSSNPVPSDSGNSSILESPANCAFSKSNSTNSSAEAEPEPAAKPTAASGQDQGKNETSAPMKETEKPKTTEKPKAAEAKPAAQSTTTAKPATKSAPATTPTAKLSKVTEKESSPTTTAAAPLKVQSREGKALDLNSTQYEHASPEPEPEAEPTGNKTHTDNVSKNEAAKDSGKKSDKLTMAPMVHENIEKKNATVTKEGKKSDDKDAHENKMDDNVNGTTQAPQAAAKTNGASPALNFKFFFNFAILSVLFMSGNILIS